MDDRVWWLAFGGKRESNENTPETTALREFREESGSAFPTPELLPCVMYNAKAKFALFVGIVPWLDKLPTFTDADAERDPTLNKRELRWFSAEAFLWALQARNRECTLNLEGDQLEVKPWFYWMLSDNAHRLRLLFQMAQKKSSFSLPAVQ